MYTWQSGFEIDTLVSVLSISAAIRLHPLPPDVLRMSGHVDMLRNGVFLAVKNVPPNYHLTTDRNFKRGSGL